MLWWLAENTILAAILAGFAALICRCCRPSPAVCHALWLVVMVKLLTPPLIHWPWPATDLPTTISQYFTFDSSSDGPSDFQKPIIENEWPERGSEAEVIFIPAEAALEPDFTGEEPLRFEIENVELPPRPEPPLKAEPMRPANAGGWFLPSASQVLVVWLVGVAAMGSWQLFRIWRFRRLLAGAKPAPMSLVNLVEELAGRLGVRPPTPLVLSGIGSPLVWSFGRARLLWPEELLLLGDSRRAVLLHELAHLRRRDHWVVWLQLMGACVWWWNPLFWLVCRQLRENAELACDAWVVELLPQARRAYAEALIQVTQVLSQRAAPVAAFGLGHGRRREFERRLTMIMKECVPCRVPVRTLVVIGLLALAALPGWTLGQQAVPPPPVPAPEQPTPAPVVSPAAGPPVAVPVAPSVQEVPSPAAPVFPPPVARGTYYVPVTGPDGVTSYQAVAAPGGDQGGDRLEQIEKQLQGLLKEVQAMRKGGRSPTTAPAKPANALPEAPPGTRVRVIREGNPPRETVIAEGGEITLTRATYKLDTAKAEALGALLKDLKNEDIVTIVEGNKITVTTSPENQRLIAPFIAFLNGQKGPRAYYQYAPRTSSEAVPARR